MEHTDVIIVLGGGIYPDGTLPIQAKARVRKGVQLWKEGVASQIIVSGQWAFTLPSPPPRIEAVALQEYAESLEVPASAIIQEDKSKDTIGNAYFCKTLFLEPNNWKNIAVVTSEFHMDRTKYIFEKVLGPEYTIDFVSVDSELPEHELKELTEKDARTLEFLHGWLDPIAAGDDAAIKHLMDTKHPGYSENPEYSMEQLLKALGRI